MSLYNMDEIKGANDAPDFYKIELNGGNSIIIYKDEIFPFWKIKYEKGLTPNKLSGSFTSLTLAQRAVDQYLAEKKVEIKPTEE